MNYVEQYRKKKNPKFQEGGAMPTAPAAATPEQMPAEPQAAQGGADEMMQMLQEVVATQNAELALQLCNILAERAGLTAQPEPATMMRKGGQLKVSKEKMNAKVEKMKQIKPKKK